MLTDVQTPFPWTPLLPLKEVAPPAARVRPAQRPARLRRGLRPRERGVPMVW